MPLIVLRLATQIVTDFLGEPEQQKAKPAVVLIGGSEWGYGAGVAISTADTRGVNHSATTTKFPRE
jgi:hypothetical protein